MSSDPNTNPATVPGTAVVPNSVPANDVNDNSIIPSSPATMEDILLYNENITIQTLAGLLAPVLFFFLGADYFMEGKLIASYYAYAGILLIMIMSMLASSYAIE